MAPGAGDFGVGAEGLGDVVEVVRPGAQDPTQEELAVGDEGRVGETTLEVVDEVLQGGYHVPHEGIPSLWCVGWRPTHRIGNPSFLAHPVAAFACSSVQKSLRKFSYANKTLLTDLPERVTFVGRMRLDAA